jgi:peroxiredoxin
MKVGQSASNFALYDMRNQQWDLSEKLGKIITLIFYPGNETMVCTKQLCSVRDNWEKYLETGAEVIAVSPGSPEKHTEFANNHSLPMTILADTNREITSRYVQHSWMPIWATRGVVVIDSKGVIRYRKVMVRAFRPSDDEVLSAIHLAKYDKLADKRVITNAAV